MRGLPRLVYWVFGFCAVMAGVMVWRLWYLIQAGQAMAQLRPD